MSQSFTRSLNINEIPDMNWKKKVPMEGGKTRVQKQVSPLKSTEYETYQTTPQVLQETGAESVLYEAHPPMFRNNPIYFVTCLFLCLIGFGVCWLCSVQTKKWFRYRETGIRARKFCAALNIVKIGTTLRPAKPY